MGSKNCLKPSKENEFGKNTLAELSMKYSSNFLHAVLQQGLTRHFLQGFLEIKILNILV